MNKIILTIIACTLSVSAFADKIISPNDEYVTFTENGSDGHRNYSTRFKVQDRDNTYHHYNVSICVFINAPICNSRVELSMQFLDKNGMLLHEEVLGFCDHTFVGTHRDIIKLGKKVLYEAEDVILIQRVAKE